MRPLLGYILLAISVVVIGMFFVYQRSRHFQIGYELTTLRQKRAAAVERGQKLEYDISQAASEKMLVDAAARMGLQLNSPEPVGPGPRR
jgi:cell division protein FtsL